MRPRVVRAAPQLRNEERGLYAILDDAQDDVGDVWCDRYAAVMGDAELVLGPVVEGVPPQVLGVEALGVAGGHRYDRPATGGVQDTARDTRPSPGYARH